MNKTNSSPGSLSLDLPVSEYGSAANHYITALHEAANMLGLNADALLNKIGLDSRILNQADTRIPSELLAKYQRLIWLKLGDETMGLNAQEFGVGTYFMMGQLTVQQASLRDALTLGVRFYNLLAKRRFITLLESADHLQINVTLQHPELDYKHLFAEICLLAWHRYASWLVADSLPITETRFPYPPPSHVKEYNYLFPGVHTFYSDTLSLIFPSHYLKRKIQQTPASLISFMHRCPLELFRQYKADYSLSTEVKRRLTKSIQSGNYTINAAAAELHMTTRTLMRKLKTEGTSFQQLKDIVRRDRAISLMEKGNLTMGEVAENVGYSDPAVFTRAFRSWTGEAPLEFKRKLSSSS